MWKRYNCYPGLPQQNDAVKSKTQYAQKVSVLIHESFCSSKNIAGNYWRSKNWIQSKGLKVNCSNKPFWVRHWWRAALQWGCAKSFFLAKPNARDHSGKHIIQNSCDVNQPVKNRNWFIPWGWKMRFWIHWLTNEQWFAEISPWINWMEPAILWVL